MAVSNQSYVEYQGALTLQRHTFFLKHGKLITAYNGVHAALETLPERTCVRRDVNGKTMVSFIPFIALMSRQTLIGFDHLVSHQAYQAWMAVRPAVEIPLMIGKWLDDPKAAEIWKQREANPKEYWKEYGTGKAMLSKSLKCGKAIQKVLKTLNDEFVHPNPFYYGRHLEMAPQENQQVALSISYFDPDSTIEVYTLAFLHLACFLHDALRNALVDHLCSPCNTEEILPSVEDALGSRAEQVRKEDPTNDRILTELGIWNSNA